jgi:hypothetical protein
MCAKKRTKKPINKRAEVGWTAGMSRLTAKYVPSVLTGIWTYSLHTSALFSLVINPTSLQFQWQWNIIYIIPKMRLYTLLNMYGYDSFMREEKKKKKKRKSSEDPPPPYAQTKKMKQSVNCIIKDLKRRENSVMIKLPDMDYILCSLVI